MIALLLVLCGGAVFVLGLAGAITELAGVELKFGFMRTWRMEDIGHTAYVLVAPVAILLMIFMVLSGLSPDKITHTFALHLTTLFIVAMVCHGEMARTRPPTRYLTEFFWLMSFGGLLGGLFNALLAPVILDRIVEYQAAMVVACLVLPTLGTTKQTKWGRIMDLGLPAVLSLLALGMVVRRYFEDRLSLELLREEFRDQPMWKETFLLIILAAMAYLVWAIYGHLYQNRTDLADRALDVATALALGVLAAGIILSTPTRNWDMEWLTNLLHIKQDRLTKIITFGLPALFCYIFVERPVRFGLCVGDFLLAGSICADLRDDVVLQRQRSFFGSIAVKRDGPYHRLVHGTTLHGKQFFNSDAEMVGAWSPR